MGLVLALTASAHAEDPVDPEALAQAISAFVTASGESDDEALVLARDALGRCRADMAAGRASDARRRCGLAEAAFALYRERTLLALARARRRVP